MMSSKRTLSVLLAVLIICYTLALDEDFAFDVSDDLEVEFPAETPKKLKGITDINAFVGRVFHLAIPKDTFGDTVKSYEAKVDQEAPLPSWLLFDKTSGVFWGVPLQNDIGTLHISVKAVRQSMTTTDEFTLIISEDNSPPEGIDKCPSSEDSTVLTLIIDKSVKAIKPKQRIIAINNIAKFFGMPYTAFMLKPQLGRDDITDSSVVLAGPGNLHSRISKDTSFVQVIVGCEGRLWLNSAPIIHQLKQQARDGTISEVLRLPLVGWRVKTENRPLLREKRQDDGSGDYEEYYEYDDYDDPDKDGDANILSSPSTPIHKIPVTTNTVEHTTTHSQDVLTTVISGTHPHRHHHGEIQPLDELEPNIPLLEKSDSHETTKTIPSVDEMEVRHSPPQTTHISSAPTSTSTTTTTTESTATTHGKESKTEKITPFGGLYKPSETLESDDEYDDEYDDDDDDDSITELPFTNNEIFTNQERSGIMPDLDVDTETTTVDSTTKAKTESVEFLPETIPSVRSTLLEILPTIAPTTTITTSEETLPPITTSPTTTTTTTTTEVPSSTTTTTMSTTTSTTTTSTTTEKFTTLEESTTTKHTTVRQIPTSSTTQKISSPQVTESIVYEVKNFPPTIQIRLNRIAVTAGKNFTQYIPEDMFSDTEDEYNLKLELLTKDGNSIDKNFWCQFNPHTREIYGLPLEEDVSRWDFLLKATDTEGASVAERVEITVQQHKSWRTVNHEFTLYARVERKQDFLNPLDWALHILHGIGNVFHSTNTSKITVRSISYATDPIIFSWTNDSLPTDYCDKSEIDEMFTLLTANEDGDPSLTLSRSLAPQLRAKKVTQRLMGICVETPVPQPPLLPPEIPITPPIVIYPPSHHIPILPSNLPPILRNPVDHVNASVGDLLVFHVPDDTFYDPEDVDPNNLKLQLYTADREPLPSDHWLQFDTKNKEFYGVPSSTDFRRMQYQLVCEDTGGLTASDTLIVEIHPSPKLKYNVEFSMTVEVQFDTFVRNPSMKRKFVEKLQSLFKDDNLNNIHLGSFTKGSSITKPSTIITWYNKTLVKDECPWIELRKLESILVNNERSMSNHVYNTMEGDFVVIAFSIQHLGVCKIITTPSPLTTTRVPEVIVPIDEGAPQESNDDYLVTFIVPAVIISAMLLLAAIAACVLYRRRRSGKMNLEEDGRQSYGNKGIPVIFQEELDEKPEPGTKTPVILKDEKPPLAPPEYSKSGSLKLTTDDSEPYQPPPPFTRTQDNGRQPRPKPTPTYRKPPPYVPP